MYGHLHSYLVASVLGAMCCISGCGTQTDTTAAALYDPAGERYGRSVPNQDVAAGIASTVPGEDVGAQAEAPNESTNSNAAASAAAAPALATNRDADGAAIGAESPTAESDALADNSSIALNARIAQLEELVTHLQAELRRGQAESGELLSATRPQIDRIASAGSSRELDNIGTSDEFRSELNTRSRASTMSRYARMDLDRLITRYKRAQKTMMRSVASYDIDHLMSLIRLGEFVIKETPIGFNTLPEKDMYAFRDLQEAADELVPELAFYLEDLATEDEQSELKPLLEEARQVTEMEAPGTGNKLLDFLEHFNEMEERYQSEQR